MANYNQDSAFYSGPTRYGGLSAVAKRREAVSRKAFFAIKEIPSTSRTSSTLNGTNMINTFTINTNDVARREPVTPQLTSHAKKILNWIEENSYSNKETITFGKKRSDKTKHRFNPMAYRAPVIRVSAINDKPTRPKVPVQTPPEPVLKLPTNLPVVTPSPPDVVKEAQPSIVVESSRFEPAKHYSPINQIKCSQCEPKKFAAPIDLNPPKAATPRPPIRKISLPEFTPPKIAKPVVSEAAPVVETVQPVEKVMQSPESPLQTKKQEVPKSTTPNISIGSKMDIKVDISPPAQTNTTMPPTISPAASKPVFMMTMQPKIPVQTPPEPILKQPTSSPIATPSPPKVMKAAQPSIMVESPRFAPAKHYIPLNQISYSLCESKKFAAPIDLSPPKPADPMPKISLPEFTLPKIVTPIVSEAAPVVETVQPVEKVMQSPESPLQTKKQEVPKSTTPNADADFEMDIEMDAAPPAPATTPLPPTISSAPTRPISMITMQPSISLNMNPVIPPAVTPTCPPPPSVTPTMPAVSTQPPLFAPPPSFPAQTFTPPLPPVTSLSMPSPSANANPFQPMASNTRGRKILRPTRRLHR